MSNMSYCRFQNTLSDLRDCADNLDNSLSTDEKKAKERMIDLMIEMLEGIGYTVDDSDLPDESDNEDS